VVAPPPAVFHGLRDGEVLRVGASAWEVLIGRGHSPGHACLLERASGILLAGDQVLPAITPNVSVEHAEPDADPLGDFLETLDRLERLGDPILVLPSHGRPFLGLGGRVLELRAHHRQRLAEVHAACTEPRTARDVMERMFPRRLDPHQATFAVGESLSHLNHLVRTGRLRRRREDGEPDRFERALRST
jgi:glyoxylase-like metal-dependent hydrolase (beta-lactamase superfamily II)